VFTFCHFLTIINKGTSIWNLSADKHSRWSDVCLSGKERDGSGQVEL